MEAETHALIRETLNFWNGPDILDADALRAEIIDKISSPERLILTPHAGEFDRLSGSEPVEEYSSRTGSIIVLKGAHSEIVSPDSRVFSFSGSSLLARGGSGDLLTGVIGALLAKGEYDLSSLCSSSLAWAGSGSPRPATRTGGGQCNRYFGLFIFCYSK